MLSEKKIPKVHIPVCAAPSPAFHMMYSAYNLNKQHDHLSNIFEIISYRNREQISCGQGLKECGVGGVCLWLLVANTRNP